MAKNYEELTAGLDRASLPATRVAPEALVLFPEAGVGDEVVVHSRGYYRVAQVLESTPKRVMVAYTTEGAWTSAQKIYDGRMARGMQHAEGEKQVGAQAAKNYDYYVRCTTDENVAEELAKWSYMTPEKAEADRQKAIEKLAKMGTKAEHVAAEVERYRQRVAEDYAEAKEKGVAGYVNITTKSVKRTEVYAIAKAVA